VSQDPGFRGKHEGSPEAENAILSGSESKKKSQIHQNAIGYFEIIAHNLKPRSCSISNKLSAM
jgi:hypothetical protein